MALKQELPHTHFELDNIIIFCSSVAVRNFDRFDLFRISVKLLNRALTLGLRISLLLQSGWNRLIRTHPFLKHIDHYPLESFASLHLRKRLFYYQSHGREVHCSHRREILINMSSGDIHQKHVLLRDKTLC